MPRLKIRPFCSLLVAIAAVLPPPGPATADEDPLVMGVFPRRNFTDTLRMFAPMADYLSGRLGRPVELRTRRSFAAFWRDVEAGRYDIVHYNQYHYVKSHHEHGYEVILKNEEFGHARIAAAIVVRRDSGVRSLTDLRGGKVIFGGGRQAMVSYVMATYLLQRAGLTEADYQVAFAVNPPNACMATYFGQAAAGGVGDRILDLSVVREKVDVEQLELLVKSRPVAHLPWAVRGDMPALLKAQVQTALADLDQSEAGRQILSNAQLTDLRRARDTEYDIHRWIIWQVTGERY